jgi:enediyne biosynthesis protein E4
LCVCTGIGDSDPKAGRVAFTDVTAKVCPALQTGNDKGRSLSALRVAAFQNSNGWYNSITAGDFDNDDMDYVAGNLGLNSWYRASLHESVTVRYSDFNKNRALDAFLFRYNEGKEYPTLSRTTLLEQIPSLKKKYSISTGSVAPYADMFTAAERKDAKELQAFEIPLRAKRSGRKIFASSASCDGAGFAPVWHAGL